MKKYEWPTDIPDEAILEEYKKVDTIKFSARPFNYIKWRSVAIGELGWWLSLSRVLPIIGITPKMLSPVFDVDDPETYDDLGGITLSEEPFKRLAKVLNKNIKVMREDGRTGEHFHVFTVGYNSVVEG